MDVGANHPTKGNMTWFLEQQGWTGLLIEPHPEMAQLLREQRLKSKTFQVAVGSPAQVGKVDFHFSAGSTRSSLQPSYDTRLTGQVIRVSLRTLDSILLESGLSGIDFLSLDVEGMELSALEGLDLERWRPKLILVEDFFYNHHKHNYLSHRGYKLVKRTGYNNWYVPRNYPDSIFSINSNVELFFIARKMWFSGPLIGLRRAFKRWLTKSRGRL